MDPMTRIVIIGGGPAGYEAALVAAQLGAQVTVVERDGIGGASVLTDCVPSKALIAAAGIAYGGWRTSGERPARRPNAPGSPSTRTAAPTAGRAGRPGAPSRSRPARRRAPPPP